VPTRADGRPTKYCQTVGGGGGGGEERKPVKAATRGVGWGCGGGGGGGLGGWVGVGGKKASVIKV